MDTGLGKPGAASPEATVHAPQVGDEAGHCGWREGPKGPLRAACGGVLLKVGAGLQGASGL